MDQAQQAVQAQYGGYLRVRACGILQHEGRILLVCHRGLNASGVFWAPPGGGVQYGENLRSAIEREFAEETHLQVSVGAFACVSEYIAPPLHAIEFFFEVAHLGGQTQLGTDPEAHTPILTDIGWFSFDEIKAMPTHEVHGIFGRFDSLQALLSAGGLVQRP